MSLLILLIELEDELELDPVLGIPSCNARSHSGPKFISAFAIFLKSILFKLKRN